MGSIGEPMADYIRQMAQLKLVYYYGGMIVPPSFLCLKNLNSLFKMGTANNNMFVVENNDRNVTSVEYNYYPGPPSNFELWREEVGHWRVQLGSYEVFLISRKHPHFHYQ